MIGDYNFDAKSHQELYDKIHANDGASFAQAVGDAWNGFRAVMGNAKAEIEAAYRDAGVDWVGAAGEAFSGAMAPLAQFAEDARAAGVETHHSVQAQQSFYHGAKNAMPPPMKVSSTANDDFFGIPAGMTHLVGGQTDQDVEEQKANEAKREAVRVMKTYRDGAASSVTSIGTFVPPPQVTAQVAETSPIQQPSNSQTRYSQQWSSQQRTTSTGEPFTPSQQLQQQQNVAPPPMSQGNDDTTGTSNYQPPADTLPRPAPQPMPPPGLQPTPNPPPIAGPLPPTMRPPQGSTPIGGTSSRGSSSGVGTPKAGSGLVGKQPGQLGRGPAAGVGSFGEAAQTGRSGQGRMGARGAAGTPGMAGAPQRGQDEEDEEHKSAPYLEELDDVWGEGTIPTVAPPVIGEDPQ